MDAVRNFTARSMRDDREFVKGGDCMGQNLRPTALQLEELEKLGLPVSGNPWITFDACRELLLFIIHGNYTVGKIRDERATIAVSYWKQWVGKRVESQASFAPGHGEVLYLKPHKVEDVGALRRDSHGRFDHLFPFQASVRFDDGRKKILALSHLRLLKKTESDVSEVS